MKIININEAKTHLSKLVEEVLQGKDVVVAKYDKPVVRLVPFQPAAQPRKLGVMSGQVTESADCWAPDPEIEKVFYGESGGGDMLVAEDKP